MPSRVIVGVIVAFWLTATSYLAYRQWWPWLRADSPPPFLVELADEAAPQVAHWSIWRGDLKAGTATTRMTVQKNDTIELFSSIDNLEIEVSFVNLKVPFKVPKLVTIQNVTREGQLVSIDSKIQLSVHVFGQTFDMKAAIEGEVRDKRLYARSTLDSFLGKSEHVLDPIPLESQSLLNPMQPRAKFPPVRPGQRWKITNVDPLLEVLSASIQQLANKHGVGEIGRLSDYASPSKVVLAEVLSEPRNLVHKDQNISCYVIEYRSDDVAGSTWVQVSDGKVLRQEVIGRGEKMVLLRED